MQLLKQNTKVMRGSNTKSISHDLTNPASWMLQQSNKLYATLGYTFSAIEAISKEVANIDMYWADGSGEKITDDWLVGLWKLPNKMTNQTMRQIKKLVIDNLERHGNAYIWAPRKNTKQIIDMTVLPSNAVTINYNATGLGGIVASYSYQGQTMPVDEIIHFRTFFPSADIKKQTIEGTPGIIQALKKVIVADNQLLTFLNFYFENDAIPPLILKSDEEIDDDVWNRLRVIMKQELGSRRVPILPAEDGLEIVPMSTGTDKTIANKLSEKSIDDTILQRVATAYGIPKPILTGTDANFATATIADKRLYKSTVKPRVDNFEDTITLFVNRYYNNDFSLTHNRLVFESPGDRDQRIKTEISHGISTANEIRSQLGYPEMDNVNGDEFLIMSSLVKLSSLQDAQLDTAAKSLKKKLKKGF